MKPNHNELDFTLRNVYGEILEGWVEPGGAMIRDDGTIVWFHAHYPDGYEGSYYLDSHHSDAEESVRGFIRAVASFGLTVRNGNMIEDRTGSRLNFLGIQMLAASSRSFVNFLEGQFDRYVLGEKNGYRNMNGKLIFPNPLHVEV